MTNCSRPEPGLATRVHALLSRGGLFLLALASLAFSGQAAASLGCDIQANPPTSQTGNTNGTLNFTFDIVDLGGCVGTQSGTITETSDPSGGFSATPVVWSGVAGDTISITINLGSTPGTSADYLVECTAGCTVPSTAISWTAATFASWQLTPLTAQSFTITTLDTVTLGVRYEVNGSPSTLDVVWGSDNGGFFGPGSTITPDANGDAYVTFSPAGPGTYNITASGSCPIIIAVAAPTTSCPPTPETFQVVVLDPVISPLQPPGGSATVPQNSSLTLKVKYAAGTTPVPDGTEITWTVTSEPSAGAGDFTGGSGTPSFIQTNTVNGTTQVTFNVTTPGTYTVQAGYCPDGCDDTYTFTITVPPSEADVSVSKTDSPDPVAVGGQLTYTITVANAGPNPAANLTLTDTLPAGVQFVSISTPIGWNCSTPPVGSTGTISCTRNVLNPAGNSVITVVTNVAGTVAPGSTLTNSVSVSSQVFDPDTSNNNFTTTTTVAAVAPGLSVVKELTGTVDNDDSGTVTVGDRLDYRVTATNTGNAPLTNVVVSDDHFAATQSCPTLAIGADCVLTGSYIVTAADLSAGSVTNVGTATSTEATGNSSSVVTPIVEAVSLSIGSGDGQSTPVNTQFPQQLTVIAGGVPPGPIIVDGRSSASALAAPNITINWTVQSGSATLQTPTSVTNASGVAANTAFAGPVPGPIVIRATRADDPDVFVEFHLTATAVDAPSFGDLPGLNENQRALAEALDEICSASSGGTGGTGGSSAATTAASPASLSDLLARCEDLADAILTDPDGVIAALDQLFADIALVQSESSLLAAQSQFENIKLRIAALRSGTNRTSFGGLALNTSSGRLPIGTMFQSLLQEEPSGSSQEVGAAFSRWGFFAGGSIGRGDADAGALSPAYDYDINGLTVGADYRKSDKLIFGGTLGYTRQTNDLTADRGSLDTKGWSVSAFGTWFKADSWYMDGVLSYGRNTYDIERHVRYTITGPGGTTTIDNTGHSSGDGDSLTFALSVGRDFNKGGWGFGPYLRAMYTKMSFDSMTETFDQAIPGHGLALELDTRDVTSVTSTLGGKLTYAHSTSWGVMIPHLQLEWQHEFMDDPSEVEARFLFDPTGTPFTIHGDPVDTDFFRFGVGMSFVMAKGRSGFFYYERLISRDRFSQNNLALGIRLEF